MAKMSQIGLQDDKNSRAAIVTGASSGIGLGITWALLERGYRVVANSRTISKSKDLKPSATLVLVDGDIGNRETAIKVADVAGNTSAASIFSSTTRASLCRNRLRNILRKILKRRSTRISPDTFSYPSKPSRKCANRNPATS
jgi:hypothetical protein